MGKEIGKGNGKVNEEMKALKVFKIIGGWIISNPAIVDNLVNIIPKKKIDDSEKKTITIEEKVESLGVATLELENKVDTELQFLYKQLHTFKTCLVIMGVTLVVEILAFIIYVCLH